MATEKDRALTIRLPEELHDQLKERADAEERTVAGILRLAARQYLTTTGR
jgi:predicted transcriptional regulator